MWWNALAGMAPAGWQFSAPARLRIDALRRKEMTEGMWCIFRLSILADEFRGPHHRIDAAVANAVVVLRFDRVGKQSRWADILTSTP